MSFLAAGKRTTLPVQARGGGSELNGQCPFKIIFFVDVVTYLFFKLQILCFLKYLFILSLDFFKYFNMQFLIVLSDIFFNFCTSSNIFLSLFYAGAASSQQRLRLRYFVTADNSIMTRAGQAGIAGNVSETSTDVELLVIQATPQNTRCRGLKMLPKRNCPSQRGSWLSKRQIWAGFMAGVTYKCSPTLQASVFPPRSYCLSSVWVLSGQSWPPPPHPHSPNPHSRPTYINPHIIPAVIIVSLML